MSNRKKVIKESYIFQDMHQPWTVLENYLKIMSSSQSVSKSTDEKEVHPFLYTFLLGSQRLKNQQADESQHFQESRLLS